MVSRRLIFVFAAYFLFSMGILISSSHAQTNPEKGKSKGDQMMNKKADAEAKETQKAKNPVVLVETSLGNMKIELFEKEAPLTVKNFMSYVKEKFYDETIFHRVIQGFMIQGGGFTADMVQKPTHPSVKNEAGNKIKNTAGTISMARTSVVDSATSQFFINLVDNQPLDHQDDSDRGYGYCVFGKVIEGMDVVNKIGKVPTTTKGYNGDVPVTPVIIKSIRPLP
jgi:cyclophilin family peptidyl-prolyl cis-trans isomerase